MMCVLDNCDEAQEVIKIKKARRADKNKKPSVDNEGIVERFI